MLRSIEGILGYQLLARDGEIGRVHDVFLDDQHWQLRYLVIETGGWLSRRHVLIAPTAIMSIETERRGFVVNLTRTQVQNSPDIDTAKPVSRQQEMIMNAYYGWPSVWTAETMALHAPGLNQPKDHLQVREEPSHLRSFREITTYTVDHRGGLQKRLQGAKVQDFVIDDTLWTGRMMIVSTGGWLDSRPFAVPIAWIHSVSWADQSIAVSCTKEQESQLEIFDPGMAVNREERVVYTDYYGRPAAK